MTVKSVKSVCFAKKLILQQRDNKNFSKTCHLKRKGGLNLMTHIYTLFSSVHFHKALSWLVSH